MLNGYHRLDAARRQHLEMEAFQRHAEAELAKARETARDQRERFEIARKQAEMQRAQAAMSSPDIVSWQGAIAAVFLLALIGGCFLAATLLGN